MYAALMGTAILEAPAAIADTAGSIATAPSAVPVDPAIALDPSAIQVDPTMAVTAAAATLPVDPSLANQDTALQPVPVAGTGGGDSAPGRGVLVSTIDCDFLLPQSGDHYILSKLYSYICT